MRWIAVLSSTLVVVMPAIASSQAAVVHYERGRRMVRGVQLLQAYSDSNSYYYVPQFPRLSMKDDSTYELLMVKYVGANAATSGGLFHALVEFTLPQSAVDSLERDLRRANPSARVVGPVPLIAATSDAAEGIGSFQLVSATLNDSGFRRSFQTSGGAPVSAGSKAAIAATLRPEGATLLWSSLQAPTSDVSIAIRAYYEAIAEGYNAKVTAQIATVYEHFSRVSNQQKEYKRRQIRNVVDSLRRDGTLSVEVLDRTAGTSVKAADMDAILTLVTDKLVDLMFDHQTGWSKDPEREAGVEPNQLLGRQEEGFFAKVFGGGDTPYYTDDQYVLKRRQDIRRNTFVLLLSRSGTVKVPVDAAGNLGGLFRRLPSRDRYFQVVSMFDTTFQADTLHFQIDGEFVDAFRDLVNFVAVNVRTISTTRPPFATSLQLLPSDIARGKTIADVVIQRLNLAPGEAFEYQVRWSLRGGVSVLQPPRQTQWLRTSDRAISLRPPLDRRVIEIDCDRRVLQDRRLASGVVQFATMLGGEARRDRQVTLRAGDTETTSRVVLYLDHNQPIGYRASWFGPGYFKQTSVQLLDGDYLYLAPPSADTTHVDGTPP
ncbi:MAG TPA: hypothetical protein VEK77_14380 [Gemmatimonadales bacterium]|nr:hypothetical protein [Gemmatimonadales bacterium]